MVFVTGATGLLGSHLLCHLAKTEKDIIALKRKESRTDETMALFSRYSDMPEFAEKRVRWVTGDVLDEETLIAYVKEAAVVYHCAAVVSFHGSDRDQLLETNIKGTEVICRLCLRFGVRLCFVSSIAALGDARREGECIDEETPVVPGSEHSLYSESKGISEKIVWNFIHEGLNAVIVNPAVILGGGLRGRSSAQLMERALRGMPVYTLGVNGYVDVRDVCVAMIALANHPAIRSERFVLCGGNYSYKHLFSTIARVAGKRPPRVALYPWMTSVLWRVMAVLTLLQGSKPVFTRETARSSQHRACFSSAKLLRVLPDFHFRSLEDTVAFFKE
ncbi:NAD-dependent epimerase/dehydratase family protein [uncultured Sanguibacteroides sp.]|uniref:NAD-dependent epimerase/dehydratase family protein n=1 Tax=uncultured Sanguibacteroides sp. TaxID=1635151 RepID=UPI0025F20542|nr:NAD-dependent epimerase/dehydratase family protein [uncultured Sanguibacteroides sp.]